VWALYAIISAWGWATSDVFAKVVLKRGESGIFFLLWVRYLISLPFLLPFLLRLKFPHLDSVFWKIHLIWIPLEVTAIYLYMKAIKISPLSLTLPLLSLTPLFLLGTSYIILGEKPEMGAIYGILLIIIGSYFLHYSREYRGIGGPFRSWRRERGSILMVFVAFIYSFTSIFGKILIRHSDPFFFSVYYAFIMSLILLPLILMEGKGVKLRAYPSLISAGFFFAIMIVFHMLSLSRAKVAYMIALKRLSGLFGIVYGGIFFRERELGFRLLGGILMLIGAILVSISKGGAP
jgi:drug/metabolite transporter (DMT)-like permease